MKLSVLMHIGICDALNHLNAYTHFNMFNQFVSAEFVFSEIMHSSLKVCNYLFLF